MAWRRSRRRNFHYSFMQRTIFSFFHNILYIFQHLGGIKTSIHPSTESIAGLEPALIILLFLFPFVRLSLSVPMSLLCLVTTPPINLLLKHNTIHTSLEQRKRQTRLALQLSQAIKYIRRRVRRQSIKYRSELARREGKKIVSIIIDA